MAKFAVTGSAGFLGSKIAQVFLDDGHSVVGIDCYLPDLYASDVKAARTLRLERNASFEFFERDLRVDPLADVLEGADAVVNCAALPGLLKSADSDDLYDSCNVVSLRRLVDVIVALDGIHLVQASTSSVYGSQAVGDEHRAVHPISAYGRSKLEAEKLIQESEKNRGLEATILRFFSLYGPNQRPDMAFAKACQAILAGERMQINGDGLQTRTNTYIDDAAAAAVLAAYQRPVGHTLNISGSESLSLLEGIAHLAEALGKEAHLAFGPRIAGDQRCTQGDAGRARDVLGWSPTIGMREGLARQAHAARLTWERDGEAARARPEVLA